MTKRRVVSGKKYRTNNNSKLKSTETATTTFGNVSSSGTMYNHDKFATPRGHGFAAEDANHLYDRLHGKDAKLVGANNAKNGADRIVDNVEIQTKYCKSGSKCIEECFKNGELKYFNSEGKPMQIEVPSDKYNDAIKSMENRIRKGEVRGVTDPAEAKNIVRQGNFTYEQVKNIAKAGNIDSIKFDATNGAIIATSALGISATITFAISIWNGEDFHVALKNSAFSGIKVGGITFVSAVVSSQLSKAGLNSMLVSSSEQIVSLMGPKASALLVNALKSGQNIYGAAAMKSAAKLLRGNVVTSVVTGVLLESFDIADIFRGRISGKQLFKNSLGTASTVAGGGAGWLGGATVGAAIGSVVPIIGTTIGGAVGGFVGATGSGMIANKVTKKVSDYFLEDDAEEMVRIIESRFSEIANDYLLNRKEVEEIVDDLQKSLTANILKKMYASKSRIEFVNELIIPLVEKKVSMREKITTPSEKQMLIGINEVLGESEINNCVNELY